ncbi:hypothetical protein QKT49_gp240 [Acanthamoeba castellanii medusavirus]|uniref:Uncharacterized protein n=1 Tax=Acanthamoeba castellanii medusavirus J1 TaxID=3114988 RepID=A0A3T1CXG5_9VIRU|nr:hypothetical protein QKT49_gp240 [Acanthamoeba castellanii medusavirus]BBI30523.1 hypothetical protein [Acanthamoeba castellanii medusavirus J1]
MDFPCFRCWVERQGRDALLKRCWDDVISKDLSTGRPALDVQLLYEIDRCTWRTAREVRDNQLRRRQRRRHRRRELLREKRRVTK